MAHRLAPEAEADLDSIWLYLARDSGSLDLADRVVDSITDRFVVLAAYPHIGRSRAEDLRPELRSFAVGAFVIFYRVDGDDVLILRVIRGSRDMAVLLGR